MNKVDLKFLEVLPRRPMIIGLATDKYKENSIVEHRQG